MHPALVYSVTEVKKHYGLIDYVCGAIQSAVKCFKFFKDIPVPSVHINV